MAIDKAIDSTAFDSKLKAVADAISSAGGTTEPMSFPSGMVEAITAIQAGGGSSWTGNYSVFATGTFTPTENATEWSIDTGVPYVNKKQTGANYFQQSLIVWREPDGTTISGLFIATMRSYVVGTPDYNGGAFGSAGGLTERLLFRKSSNPFPNEGETIWQLTGNKYVNFRAGKPYRWVLLGTLK